MAHTHMPREECYSRKVFIGGLPFDIEKSQIMDAFTPYGKFVIDWPKRAPQQQVKSRDYAFPGYVFVIFHEDDAVHKLLAKCFNDKGKYYIMLSSKQTVDKPVQVRPWHLKDTHHIPRPRAPLNPRHVVFVGGLPRTTTASELAFVMEQKFGHIAYAGIDIDPELKYPKGAGRVAFCSYKTYIDAMRGRFVVLPSENKQAEIKPYVVEDQPCDECKGAKCDGRFDKFFCDDINCLQYYCEYCWNMMHNTPTFSRRFHKPFFRLGQQPTPIINV